MKEVFEDIVHEIILSVNKMSIEEDQKLMSLDIQQLEQIYSGVKQRAHSLFGLD